MLLLIYQSEMRAYFVEQCLHFLFNFFILLCIIYFKCLEVSIMIDDVMSPVTDIIQQPRLVTVPIIAMAVSSVAGQWAWSNHNRILHVGQYFETSFTKCFYCSVLTLIFSKESIRVLNSIFKLKAPNFQYLPKE